MAVITASITERPVYDPGGRRTRLLSEVIRTVLRYVPCAMRQNVRARASVLAVVAAGAGLASAGFVALARAGFVLCSRHLSAADAMRMDGMPGMSGMASAAAGSGDVCPLVLNVALVLAALALAVAAWLILSAAAPIVGALAAALRIVVEPGAGARWLSVSRPSLVPARAAIARRRPSRAPPNR
jgi:hypothetical protein